MNKSEQREVQKAVNAAGSNPAYAAAVLAPLMRATNKKTYFELIGVMNDLKLRDYMEVVNGCFVAKSI